MNDKPVTQREGPRGLRCRHCGCAHLRVIYTRRGQGERIVRRRECRNCGKRLTTWEQQCLNRPV